MNKSQITICFTGHRPQSLPFGANENDNRCVKLKAAIKAEVERLITERGAGCFISGMALGIDTFCAEIVLELKYKYPHITLECALPCENQAVKWNEKSRDRYFDIISKCDKETMLQKHYTADCMQRRNEYMVNSSDILIAIWNGKGSGTGNTVRYAQKQGKEIIIIDPTAIE